MMHNASPSALVVCGAENRGSIMTLRRNIGPPPDDGGGDNGLATVPFLWFAAWCLIVILWLEIAP